MDLAKENLIAAEAKALALFQEIEKKALFVPALPRKNLTTKFLNWHFHCLG